MVNVSSQSTYTSGRAQNYAKKDAVAISALNASVPLFEKRLQEIRVRHGKDGMRPRALTDSEGNFLRDASGTPVPARDANGRPIYQSTHVQAYCLIQSFGHDELDPHDPESWTIAQELGRTLAEERFPGHPALIATEINGRSGCVHNHIVVGAVHPKTGKSIDSNVVTHSRLAIAHDRVLAANGFTQRADMALKSQNAEQAMAAARAAVLADPASAALSPSHRQRRITAAENAVRLHRDTSTSAAQARESRRLREFDRYQFTERDRLIAADLGMAPPAERFSEVELEARVKEALSDPRFQSWDDLSAIAREYRVTIAARGQDVSFGMMLLQPDGTLAEPARAHVRRGGRPGTNKGLGDGFRRGDVEAAIKRNVRAHEQPQQRPVEQQPSAMHLEHLRRIDELAAQRRAHTVELQAASEAAWASAIGQSQQAPEPTQKLEPVQAPHDPRPLPYKRRRFVAPAPTAPAVPTVAFRSEVRDLPATTDTLRRRLNGLAEFEERWREQLPDTPEERIAFEQQATEIGIGPKLLEYVNGHLDPELQARLTQRAEQAVERQRAFERAQRLKDKMPALERDAKADPLGIRGDADKCREARRELSFETGYVERIDANRAAGIYTSRGQERTAHLRQKNAQRVAQLDGYEPSRETSEPAATSRTAAQQRLLDKQMRQRRDNQKATETESQGMEM
ncbi:relaxase/mobilization nuclease domain-containing protein [Microbacterium gorillae]|uniref:relaxase/mobilization nuclease domain-containing protein n=1 Tax=Microbacterium gorillae TaxID=1231063 RepID=UPI003D95E7B1